MLNTLNYLQKRKKILGIIILESLMFYTLINPMDATNQVIEIKESDLLRFKNPWSNIKNFTHTIL